VGPDPSGTYSAAYTTPRSLLTTTLCDRFLQYAIISLGRGGFDLSMNVFQDCRRSGNGYASWEVLILGHYTAIDTTLVLTPESRATPTFTGTFDGEYIRLNIPSRPDSLGQFPFGVELGPKQAP
jgi:hypothetical protein